MTLAARAKIEYNKLTKAKSLDLSKSEITDLSFIAKMTWLTMLELWNNQIKDITPLQSLTNLTVLSLNTNQLTDITPLQNLTNLLSLGLGSNQLTDITPLQSLTNLRWLFLKDNKITDITPLQNLTNLKMLDFRNNQLTEVKSLFPLFKKGMKATWQEKDIYKGIFLENNPFDPALIARIQQGNEAIIDYYQELDRATETGELYEARLMVIGEPRAGKTTLQRKLMDIGSAMPLESETTEGIATSDNTDIGVHKNSFAFTTAAGKAVTFYYNIWDFGGQRQYHPTHQLFFAKNAVYLLVTNTDWNKNEEDVDYWLSTVKKLGIDSPVLRIENMPKDRPDESDWSLVQQAYGSMIKGVFPINLKRINPQDTAHYDAHDHNQFKRLEREIRHQLKGLKHIGSTVPKTWTDIRGYLTQLPNNPPYISWTEFVAVCEKFHYDDPMRQKRLSQTFHDLGIFLHYHDNEVLKHTIILKNKWAIDALFAVVDSPLITRQKGAFTDSDLPKIWTKPTYKGKEQELLNVLKKFELCYPLSGNRGYVAPQRLPKMPSPQYIWDKTDNVLVDIEYDFLPRTVITRLIVKLHRHIAEDKNWVWQNGVVIDGTGLGCPNTATRIQENYKLKTLSLQLRGAYSEGLVTVIKSNLYEINESFDKLNMDFIIHCSCDDCKAVPRPTKFKYHEELLRYRYELNKDTIECKTKGKPVLIAQLLRGIVSAEQAAQDSQPHHYHNYFHNGDNVWGDKMGGDKVGGNKFGA